MKVLEIGPTRGKRQHPGWKTLNCRAGKEIDYVCDITKPLRKVPQRAFDLVYMSHVLEHVPWFNTVATLKNIRAVIAPGGSIEVWVPDFAKIVEQYLHPDMSRDRFRHLNPKSNLHLWLAGRIFAGTTQQPKIYTKISVWHKALFDEAHLKHCLVRAGYKNPELLDKPRGYSHGWINLGMKATV